MEIETEPYNFKEEKIKKPRKYLLGLILMTLALLTIATWLTFSTLNQAPDDFPLNSPVTIPEGSSAKKATQILGEGGYVKSELVLYLSLLFLARPQHS
ncbi:MAG: hypothetical protein R3B53_03935 [Candidatus Paceibacterota bacterium]